MNDITDAETAEELLEQIDSADPGDILLFDEAASPESSRGRRLSENWTPILMTKRTSRLTRLRDDREWL